MIIPTLVPRVKEFNERASLSLNRTAIAPLPCIASKASVGKVIGIRQPARFAANDVVCIRQARYCTDEIEGNSLAADQESHMRTANRSRLPISRLRWKGNHSMGRASDITSGHVQMYGIVSSQVTSPSGNVT